MKRATHALFAGLLRPVLVLSLVAGAWPASRLLAVPPDGTYAGSTDQGRSISVVVAGGQILTWTVNYQCPGFTATTTVNTGSCFVLGNSFNCGSTFCAPFVASTQVSGTFTGTAVAGTLNVRHQPNQFSSCCALTNRSWSGARSCTAGDTDFDGVCDDLDVCPGFDDNADGDGDSVPDGCDQCLGDDAAGDIDMDGLCEDVDLCVGENATGDMDADGVCADLDCDDNDPTAMVIDNCGLCGGDDATCAIFSDGFESGDVSAWNQ
jgi:hypothetical protein